MAGRQAVPGIRWVPGARKHACLPVACPLQAGKKGRLAGAVGWEALPPCHGVASGQGRLGAGSGAGFLLLSTCVILYNYLFLYSYGVSGGGPLFFFLPCGSDQWREVEDPVGKTGSSHTFSTSHLAAHTRLFFQKAQAFPFFLPLHPFQAKEQAGGATGW